MAFQVQVTGEWAGVSGGWRPAVSGTLNETGRDDTWASTSDTREEAQDTLEYVLLPELGTDPEDGDPRDRAPRFRIIEISVRP